MSIEYEIYRKEVIDFLQTASIKFDLFAEAMTKRVEVETGIILTSPEQNPYYQNLCGIYSVLDPPIYVTTIETNEQVLFDKNLFVNFPKTAQLYKIPSIEYEILCQKYPNQVGLIKSIIYPAKDLQTVIAAENFTLLAYDITLLHSNERESLLTTLRKVLDYIHYRWYIADYSYEEMYPVTFMGMVWALLPQVLLAQRAMNLKTSQVHPMHIWEYLISKGLKDYRDILNDKQALFLYRNIEYLLQNKGKKSNLEILASNLLKDLQVSLVGKTILQQTVDGFDDCRHIPEFLSEDVIRFGLNEQYEESETEDMQKILYRIQAEGYYPNLSPEIIESTEERFGETELNVVPTRLLELKKHVIYKPYEKLLVRFLFDSFLYNLSESRLTYRVGFVDPNVNVAIDLSLEEAIALFQYAHHKELGTEIENIPVSYFTYTPYREDKPSLTSLPKYYTFEGSKYLMTSIVDVKGVVQDIYFDDKTYSTTEEFQTVLSRQFSALIKHVESLRKSGNLLYHRAFNDLYKNFLVQEQIDLDLVDSPNYSSWISSNDQIKSLVSAYDNLPNSRLYWSLLCDQLVDHMIPTDNDLFREHTSFNQDKTVLYNGLKKLFIQLCSYRLTFLETDRDRITFLTIPQMCCGNTDSENTDYSLLGIPGVDIESYSFDEGLIDLTVFDSVDVIESTTSTEDTTPQFAGPRLAMIGSDTDVSSLDDFVTIKNFQDGTEETSTYISFGSRSYISIEQS